MITNKHVYKDCEVKMSPKALGELCFAAIVCNAGLPTFFALQLFPERKQNSHNLVCVKVHIEPERVKEFEKLAGVELEDPIQISLNSN